MNATETYRWIPTGAVVAVENGLGIVYLVERNGQFHGVAYKGKAGKPSWNYLFRTRERFDAHVASWLEGLNAWARTRKERAWARTQPHSLKVGAVIYNSWGYDQTNIDFYEVVAVSANYVSLRELCDSEVAANSSMSGRKIALPGQFASEEITRHRVYVHNGAASVNFKHGAGSVWDGRPMYYSWDH